MTPVLSIVVGTRNRPDSFRRLAQSIRACTTVAYEVIVADASDVPLVETDPHFKMLREHPPVGFSKGYNAACKRALGKYTLILNDDCEVLPGYAEAAVNFMEQNPQFGIGALPYRNKGGPFQINWAEGMPYANFPILSTELGNRIGWHDEEIQMYGADNSLTFRVLLAGLGIAEIPNARLLHYEDYQEHNHRDNMPVRYQQADLLWAKYLPHIDQMRHAYEQARMVAA